MNITDIPDELKVAAVTFVIVYGSFWLADRWEKRSRSDGWDE